VLGEHARPSLGTIARFAVAAEDDQHAQSSAIAILERLFVSYPDMFHPDRQEVCLACWVLGCALADKVRSLRLLQRTREDHEEGDEEHEQTHGNPELVMTEQTISRLMGILKMEDNKAHKTQTVITVDRVPAQMAESSPARLAVDVPQPQTESTTNKQAVVWRGSDPNRTVLPSELFSRKQQPQVPAQDPAEVGPPVREGGGAPATGEGDLAAREQGSLSRPPEWEGASSPSANNTWKEMPSLGSWRLFSDVASSKTGMSSFTEMSKEDAKQITGGDELSSFPNERVNGMTRATSSSSSSWCVASRSHKEDGYASGTPALSSSSWCHMSRLERPSSWQDSNSCGSESGISSINAAEKSEAS